MAENGDGRASRQTNAELVLREESAEGGREEATPSREGSARPVGGPTSEESSGSQGGRLCGCAGTPTVLGPRA